MGSEMWALVGVVVGALIAGVLQIFAGVLQRGTTAEPEFSSESTTGYRIWPESATTRTCTP
jgi:hypothetical protein